MSHRSALDLHSICTKTGAMQIKRLKSIAPLHGIPGLPGICLPMALWTMDARCNPINETMKGWMK